LAICNGQPPNPDITGLEWGYQNVVEGAATVLGTATLGAGGTVTVADASVTVKSNIALRMLTPGGTPGAAYVSSKTAGTGFVITSTSSTDTSIYAYELMGG
jgi:hypothetical protein